MTESVFARALEHLYRAALDPDAWATFIDEFSRVIGAQDGHRYLGSPQTRGTTFGTPSLNYSVEPQTGVPEHWQCKDEMVRRSFTRGVEWLFNPRQFDKQYVPKDPFHNEFLFPNDIYHVTEYRTNSTTAVSSTISCFLGHDQKPMEAEKSEWLPRLQPHFKTASCLHREMLRLKLGTTLREQTLDILDYPILILYENRFIAFLNAAAEIWLSSNVAIGMSSDRMVGNKSCWSAKLSMALQNVFKEGIAAVLAIPHPHGEKPYQMMVAPLNPTSPIGTIWQRPVALAVVAAPHSRTPLTLDQLQTLFGLTVAESRVAMGLADGQRLDEIAEAGEVSINTVRTQMKNAMYKTGSRRQTELIKALNTMPKLRAEAQKNDFSKLAAEKIHPGKQR